MGVLLVPAQVAGVLPFDVAERLERLHVPATLDDRLFEEFDALVGFDEPNSARAGLKKKLGEGERRVRVGHVRVADRSVEHVGKLGSGEVDLHRHRFAADQSTDAPKEVERLGQAGVDFGVESAAPHDGDLGVRFDAGRERGRGWRRFREEWRWRDVIIVSSLGEPRDGGGQDAGRSKETPAAKGAHPGEQGEIGNGHG